MRLGDIITQLSYGELKDLHIGGSGKGNIPCRTRDKVISYINQALREIYVDFPMMTKEVTIALRDNVSVYTLHSDYAVCNKTSPVPQEHRYIEDTPRYPFTDDVMRIDEIHNITGNIQQVNNYTSPQSISVVGYNQVQVARPITGERLVVSYQATPKEIPQGACDNTEVDIPPTFAELLRSYVAYLAFGGMTTQTGMTKSGEYYGKYQMVANRLREVNVLNQHNTAYNALFDLGGWV